MTLLSIVQDAAEEVFLPSPLTVIGNTDLNVSLLRRLANKEGKELVRKYDWQALTKEKTFTSVATETQTSIIPTDFDHFVDETFWNRTDQRMFLGPLTPQEWQTLKGTVANVVLDAFRRRGNDVIVTPTPSAGETYAFEYISKYWVDTDQDGDGDAWKWEADDDTALVDEEIITQGTIWRYKHAKGLDYAEDFRTYEMNLIRLFGDDGGKRTLDLSGHSLRRQFLRPAVPEGNWSP